MRRLLLSLFVFLSILGQVDAQNSAGIPMIGAQIIVEPWQSAQDVDLWFKTMRDNGMSVCRIRMFEEYLKSADGTWCFDCFDTAFDAAAKYGIKVFATLFPSAKGSNSLGGFKHPADEEHLLAIGKYVKAVVQHFKAHPALYGWVLMNEPGTGGSLQKGDFTSERMREWASAPKKAGSWTDGYTSDIFNNKRFLVEHNTWYIHWLSEEVQKYDDANEVHINNHQIFENVAEYDFPTWRLSLTSLGASAHPSWHFGFFQRDRYAMAMSANCQIIKSGAGELPFWVTELQGGNNTYSGNKAFCPTAEETAQWLWCSIANGAKGVIFWCYNPRTVGEEAGEWALINNDNSNSDRLDAAKDVSACLNAHSELFAEAKPVDSHINVIYIRESIWAETQMQIVNSSDIAWEGRQKGGVMKSAIGAYESLLSYGINANFKEFAEFDWSKEAYEGEVIILANQIAIPSYYTQSLKHFVEKGGKLIIEGLTGFYDENLRSLNNADCPFQTMLGGILKEVKATPGDFKMPFIEYTPVHLWKGFIANSTGTVLSTEGEQITSTRNTYGKGETVWIPSLLALGARRSMDYAPFATLLKKECPSVISFSSCEPSVLMNLMETPTAYVAAFINKSSSSKAIKVQGITTPCRVVYANKGGRVRKNVVQIDSEETLLVVWPKP